MTLKSKLPVACVAIALMITGGLGGGCSATKKPTQKQAAHQHWDRARATVMYGLAKDQYATGNFEPARKTVDDALRLDPDHGPLRILSAKLAIEAGNLDRADKDLAAARKANPRDAEADYLAGVVNQRWQKPEVALEFYSTASEKDAGELAYLLAKSEMLVMLGREEEALRTLQAKVVYFESSAVIRDAVGQLLIQFKKYDDAVTVLRQASILATDDAQIHEHLAYALYFNKQYGEAVEPFKKVLKNEENAKRADLHLALGKSLLEIGKLREAKASLETAAQLDDANPAVWVALGRVAMQLGDEKRAELSLKKAAATDPANGEAKLLMGYLRLRQKRFNDALSNFQRAAALDTRDTTSLCMIGYTLQKLGRNDEATQYYAKALRIKPGDEMARKLLASVDTND
jgi:tetratricopeptide (TPR) repeat protein